MTEVSHQWLDRIVEARQRLEKISGDLYRLKKLLNVADPDTNDYHDGAATILERDGTRYRYEALMSRQRQIRVDLGTTEGGGYSVGPVLMGLTELADAVQETLLNTEALIGDAEPAEDPFYDRLEEHPAYERS